MISRTASIEKRSKAGDILFEFAKHEVRASETERLVDWTSMSLVVFVRLTEEDFTGRNRGPGAILARGTASRRRGAEFHVNKRLAQTIAKTKMLDPRVERPHRVILVDLIWKLAQFDMQDLHAVDTEQYTKSKTKYLSKFAYGIVERFDIAAHRFPERTLWGHRPRSDQSSR